MVAACDQEPGDVQPGNDDQVRALLAPLVDDPATARRLLTGTATADLEEEAASAGLPTSGRVTWLVADREFSEETVHVVAATVTAAAQRDPGGTDDAVAAQLVASGDLDSRLLEAPADVIADRVGEALGTVRRSAPWSPDDLAGLLRRLGADAEARATVAEAVMAEADDRLRRTDTATELLGAEVAVPAGWLLGALDAGALDGLDEMDARELVDDRRLELETLAERALVASGRSREAARSMAATISRGYSEGLAAAE